MGTALPVLADAGTTLVAILAALSDMTTAEMVSRHIGSSESGKEAADSAAAAHEVERTPSAPGGGKESRQGIEAVAIHGWSSKLPD